MYRLPLLKSLFLGLACALSACSTSPGTPAGAAAVAQLVYG
ncbi:hypothetical protein [Cellvibrio japonicus]|uniref:Putative lipoprotein n=1 Tax=Cellvibrio japonicus (strain Ueda107) TaxID=498211 RepID=B3PH04_CELJU|nr:hypothetical protein [Cellvibrio japonicus]ACE84637.1 putative lipoprotein [Cellvibrio japonicus Ueda107]